MKVAGSTILVTGASSGIGAALAPPDLKGIIEFKTSDIDTFLEGAAAMARRPAAEEP